MLAADVIVGRTQCFCGVVTVVNRSSRNNVILL